MQGNNQSKEHIWNGFTAKFANVQNSLSISLRDNQTGK